MAANLDKAESSLTVVSDISYLRGIDGSGNSVRISKSDLASVLGVNKPFYQEIVNRNSGSIKVPSIEYGSSYHVYITSFNGRGDNVLLGEYLVTFGNAGVHYLISLREKASTLEQVTVGDDGTISVTLSNSGYYRIRIYKV